MGRAPRLTKIEIAFPHQEREGRERERAEEILRAFLGQCAGKDPLDIPKEFHPFIPLAELSLQLAERHEPIDIQTANSHLRSLQILGPDESEKRSLLRAALLVRDLQFKDLITPPLERRAGEVLPVKHRAVPQALERVAVGFAYGQEQEAGQLVREELDHHLSTAELVAMVRKTPRANSLERFMFADYLAHRPAVAEEQAVREELFQQVIQVMSKPEYVYHEMDTRSGVLLERVFEWGREQFGNGSESPAGRWLLNMQTVQKKPWGQRRIDAMLTSCPAIAEALLELEDFQAQERRVEMLRAFREKVNTFVDSFSHATVNPHALRPEHFVLPRGEVEHITKVPVIMLKDPKKPELSPEQLGERFRELFWTAKQLGGQDMGTVAILNSQASQVHELIQRAKDVREQWAQSHPREVVRYMISLAQKPGAAGWEVVRTLDSMARGWQSNWGPGEVVQLLKAEQARRTKADEERKRREDRDQRMIDQLLEGVRRRLGRLQKLFSRATGLDLEYQPEGSMTSGPSIGSISMGLSQRLVLEQRVSLQMVPEDAIQLELGNTVTEARERTFLVDWVGAHEFGHAVDREWSDMADEIAESTEAQVQQVVDQKRDDAEAFTRLCRECVMDGYGLAMLVQAGTSLTEDKTPAQRLVRAVESFVKTVAVVEQELAKAEDAGEQAMQKPAVHRLLAAIRFLGTMASGPEQAALRAVSRRLPAPDYPQVVALYVQVMRQAQAALSGRLKKQK